MIVLLLNKVWSPEMLVELCLGILALQVVVVLLVGVGRPRVVLDEAWLSMVVGI